MGRPLGSKNKDNRQALIAMLQAKYPGYHPVMEMARIAHETDDTQLAANMHKEVAQYVLPKLRSVEVSGPNGEPIKVATKEMVVLPVTPVNKLPAPDDNSES